MKAIIHKAEKRGHANYGWLDTWYSFSFANYYNPEKMNFGSLRVLNDDFIDGGRGFDFHPHENMEIVTIMLDGALEHRDDMGNVGIIKKNEVQVMSAGTGVFHSEKNADATEAARLFQIWIFPRVQGLKPRYDQRYFDPIQRKGVWQYIVSPDMSDTLLIAQDAWLAMADLEEGASIDYNIHKKDNVLFVMNIDGSVQIGEMTLEKRDAACISETERIKLRTKAKSQVLVIEIPN